MRLFFSGPRILGIRPGISFGAEDLFGGRRKRTQAAAAEPMTGSFVYVVRGDHNVVKIGVTRNPRARLASLRTASAFPIEYSYIAFTDNCGPMIEGAAHTLLERYRINGEWYDVAPEMAVAALSAAAHNMGRPLLQVSLDNADQILKVVASGGQLPTADDGWLFGGLPSIIKWPLRIIVAIPAGIVLGLALSILAAIFDKP
jgi:hypothetical protein